ncbi:class I SAM-dependent methyltransferase [Pseudonocardia acaciae]|uniref:class I SAM-dependent methyltransferase n=1 Tax=Pseudonocardia acaciae TaxID=551276 RepID=UPI00048EFECE|nr:class I SAM-dependent methyltransferase [Pseudonocardia acaciae]
MNDYVAANRANWDERAPMHVASPDYQVERFVSDPEHLSGVVRFDMPRLGPVDGLRAVHLQCHIGTDTLSLARLGARMTGLDFSAASLEQARRLAERTGTDIDFREAELYDAVDVLGAESFDLVYTGIGALYWLPDVARWARVVAGLLRPGGRLFIRENHPILETLDVHESGIGLYYPYFEQPEPLRWDEPGTYVQTDGRSVQKATVTYGWSHGVSETITGLLDAGMRLTQFVEHDSAPWNALPGHMVADDMGEWRLREKPERLAASFTIQAVKTHSVE